MRSYCCVGGDRIGKIRLIPSPMRLDDLSAASISGGSTTYATQRSNLGMASLLPRNA